jgi:hypothetical protein
MKNTIIGYDSISKKKVELEYEDIYSANCWYNIYGNPQYGVYMKDGKNYILVDNYSLCRSYVTNLNYVSRKKDL